VSEHDRAQRESPPIPDGPRVGLATFDASDPDATFRPIEPFQPPHSRERRRAAWWALWLFVGWLVNLAALVTAGLIVTSVGADDPFAYVAWAAVFGLVNARLPLASRLGRAPRAAIVSAVLSLAVNVVMVWLMTAVAPPFHAPGVAAIAKAAALMWLANLPLRLLIRRRPTRAVSA
jgi:putative membrane protein